MKAHKFHPYKVYHVPELNEDEVDRRSEFCEGMSERVTNNPNMLFNNYFSDEFSFYAVLMVIIIIIGAMKQYIPTTLNVVVSKATITGQSHL